MRLFFVVGVVGVLVASAMLYSWYVGEEEVGEGLTYLNVVPTLGVDNETERAQLTFNHNGGQPVIWGEWTVSCGGSALAGNPMNDKGETVESTKKGQSAFWRFSNISGRYIVGETYTVLILKIGDNCIAYSRDVVAIAQDIPAP